MFTINGNNGGMVVSKDYYLRNKDTRNEGINIVDKALDNGDMGFSVKDNVDMMVQSKMGAKIALMQAKITNANVQKSAIAQFQTTMKTLVNETLKPLDTKSALTSFVVNNSDPTSIGVTTSETGTSNNLSVSLKVKALASSESVTVGGFSSNTVLHAGTIKFDFGKRSTSGWTKNDDSQSVSIEVSEGMSLEALADKINSAPKGAIKATVVTHDDGSRELAIISNRSGSNNALQISSTGNKDLVDRFTFAGADTPYAKERQTASDAKYLLNGIEMTSPSNTIKDVMGLNLSLNAITKGDVRISTSSNPDAVITNVNAFVQNVNSLQEMLNKFNSPSPDKDFTGSFKGTEMSDEIEKKLSGLFDGFRATHKMASIGITRDAEGKLTLDTAKLKKELIKNPEVAYEMLGTSVETSTGSVDVSNIGNLPSGDHSLVITRKPEKATLVGSKIGNSVTLSKDVVVKMEINSSPVSINVKAGTYTAQQLTAKLSAAIQDAGFSGITASLNGGSIQFESNDYGSLQSIAVKDDVLALGLSKSKASGVDISGTLDGETFLGDGATYKSRFGEHSKGFEFSVDTKTIDLNKLVNISVSKGLLSDMKKMYSSVDNVLVENSDKIKEELKETSSFSLISQLDDLKDKEDYYYNFYYQQFSGVSAMISKMKGIGDMLDAMFNSKESN
ncbi:flagellar filament capping protein FliD [Photobacterium kishitanii]|uniref:Flagellar hook-associated protein 2 n=1 Tax=Photobacterium kishitanii TaxID=318456 RepID=A0A2T3KMT4_9GAMM|nr:flagellar filament capping protein FliD [Photobacterium kishitanii]PSV01101.1 hypothetical protein C9J27_03520 [Photobacterium kishitanii]